MTLLAIVRDAANEVGVNIPATIIGNTDPAAEKLLRFATRVGSDLVTRGTWQVLRTQATFTAIPGEAQPSVVPADLSRVVAETLWDRTNQRLIAGPIPGAQWQSLAATQPAGSWPRWWTLRGGDAYIFPAMQGGESMAFEYVSRNFCASSGGTPQAAWLADTDVPVLPQELFTLGVIAFYLRSEGLPYADAMRDYEMRLISEAQNDMPASGVLSAGDIFGGRRAWPGAPAADGGSGLWFV